MPPKSSKREADGKDGNNIQGLLLEKDLEIETLLDKITRLEKRSQPPKSSKREADGKDGNNIQGLLLEKDLEIETLLDKITRLEKRSQSLEETMEKQQAATREMEEKLQDVITSLASELKIKEEKVYELQEALNDLKAENMRAIEDLTRSMHELQNTHKFMIEDFRLQLANAQVQLRDIDEFNAKKEAIEHEISSLKEQLVKERKEHEHAISDTERSALLEKERLKKEMFARIDKTRIMLLQQMDEQLHAKTKKTIAENEQLGKELNYHIRQTDLLLQKNEKLVQENIDLHRQVILAKEVESELARRNHMNQKTIQILLYKLQSHCGSKHVHQESSALMHGHDQAEYEHLEIQIKNFIQEQKQALETSSSAEAAMKFLYACLEDIELEKIMGDESVSKTDPQHVTATIFDSDGNLQLPSSLDQLTYLQRQELLMHLLRTAISLRAVKDDVSFQRPACVFNSMISFDFLPTTKGNVAVSVEDILHLPVTNSTLACDGRTGNKPVSIGIQTEPMNLEERLALEINELLRPCSALGTVV